MSEELKTWIGERVLVSRTHSKLTQESLADLIGRSVEAVSNIERGVSLPTIDTVARIAKAVSVPMSFFFEGLLADPQKDSNMDALLELNLIVRGLSRRDARLLVALAKSMQEG